MDHGWTTDGSWMDHGWIMDGPWMDHGLTKVGPRMDQDGPRMDQGWGVMDGSQTTLNYFWASQPVYRSPTQSPFIVFIVLLTCRKDTRVTRLFDV